jgi:fatty acid desaturase
MEKSYKLLSIGKVLFVILAWVALALGLIACIVILIGGGTPEVPRLLGLVWLLTGILYFFFFFVVSQIIAILLDIKEAVRKEHPASTA